MNWILALSSGLLLVALFPHFGIGLLAPFALSPLLIAIAREDRPLYRFLLGEVCGFVFWIGLCYWIRPVLAEYGGLNLPLSWLALILFAVAKGIHLAVFSFCAGYLIHRAWAIPALAALWVGIERTHGTFGFAWLTLGNAASEMSLPLRLAPFVGVYGVSFVMMLLNAGLALLLLRRPRKQLVWLMSLPLLFLLPELPELERGKLRATSLQPNLEEGTPPNLDRMASRSLINSVNGSSLVLWPEAPSGFYWDSDPVFRHMMSRLAQSAEVPFLFAGVTHTENGSPLNTAILLDETGKEKGRYSKTYLVPFGEFVPPLFSWIDKVSTEAGSFSPGDGPGVMSAGSLQLGTFICYESAFPHLVRQFPALGATVLVNLSNDGWFFRTAAREQHLLLARMRAVENRRWVLRSTNNGITTSIDPAGRVMEIFPEFREMAGQLEFSEVEETTFYSRHGDWFGWTSLVTGLGLTLFRMRASKQTGSDELVKPTR